ncbi:MAG: hypothetical protein HY812_05470 [Planctomycetes bacterium]|nr:hypothetical protein [Planctomycetota bacterium]
MIAPFLCLVLATTDPSSADLLRRTYPLDAVLPPPFVGTVLIDTQPITPLALEKGSALLEEESSTFHPDALVDLLRQTVMPEEWEYVGRSVDYCFEGDRSFLVVEAPPDVQEEVERFLGFVALVARSRLSVRADVYKFVGAALDSGLPAGTLDREGMSRLEALVRAGTLRLEQSFRMSAASGVPVHQVACTRRTFLEDFDVEIAQAAILHQPVVDGFQVGVEALFRADRHPNGGALVSFVVRDAWFESSRDIDLRVSSRIATEKSVEEVPSGGVIQSPRVAFCTIGGSALLMPGETAAVLAAGPDIGRTGPGILTTLTLEAVPQAPVSFECGERCLALQDLAGAVSVGFQAPRLGWDSMITEDGELETGRSSLPLLVGLPPAAEGAVDGLERLVQMVYESEEGEVSSGYLGTLVYVAGSKRYAAPWMNRIAGALSDRPAFSGAALALAMPGNDAAASVPLLSFSAPVGDAFAVCGTQDTCVIGHDVDVANNCSVFNPYVVPVTSGWAARLSARDSLAGSHVVSLFVCSHIRDGDQDFVDPNRPGTPGMHLPAFNLGVVESTVDLEPGARQEAGSLALGDGTNRIVTLTGLPAAR